MLKSQVEIINFCDKLSTIAKENGLPETFVQNVSGMKNGAEQQELVVPVVGAFSAGKSTLINNCLGRKVLPEAVSPETSLATELRYSGEEFVEAVKSDGGIKRYAIDDMVSLKNDATHYLYARVFLNNPALKEIEPLVLVDMPGFDSPLDAHNKAILAYLARGSYYVVLSSGAEEKTPSSSLIRRLREIKGLERPISFFVSKTNLLGSKEEIDQMVAHYKSTLQSNLNSDIPVGALGADSGGELLNLLRSIDADQLFLGIYRSRLKALCYELIELLNIRVSASQKDAEENKRIIDEMTDSVQKIEKKADSLISDIKGRYSKLAVNDLVSSVGSALDSSLTELVATALRGDNDRTEKALNDIVRVSLTAALKTKMGDLINEITMDFSSEISGLGTAMQAYTSEPNYAEKLAEKSRSLLNDLQITDTKGVGDGNTGKKNVALMGGYTAIMGVLSLISGGVITVMETVIMFLPELLAPIIGFIQKKKQEADIRGKFQTEIFPAIKQKIRSEIPGFLDGTVEKIITQVRDQYSLQIEQQKEEVSASIEAAKSGAEEIERQKARLEAALSEAKAIANKVA
jgi:predicted GTPase